MSRARNVHLHVPATGEQQNVSLVKGDYEYWHYCCDGCDERGWGCGYRTLQTICSWVRFQQQQQSSSHHSVQDKDAKVTSESSVTDRNSSVKTSSAAYGSDGGIMPDMDQGISSDFSNAISVIGSGNMSASSTERSEDLATFSDSDLTESEKRVVESTSNITVIASGTADVSKCLPGNIVLADLQNNVLGYGGASVGSSGDRCDRNDVPATAPTSDVQDLHHQHPDHRSPTVHSVPSLLEIQQALVKMGDKPNQFVGSRQWIGSYEVCLCLDFFYDVPCKILHITQGADLRQHLTSLQTHFSTLGSPVMMGGDSDASSKGIVGVCTDPAALLVVDPHYSGTVKTAASLHMDGWVKWVPLEDFHQTSFYNLCFPQLTAL